MSSGLRLTDTNASTDSAGLTWGLEGNLVWWLIGGAGAGLTVFFLLLVVLDLSFLLSLGLGAVPFVLALLYILLLRRGKPPGYDLDLLDHCLGGSHGFSPETTQLPKHPFDA